MKEVTFRWLAGVVGRIDRFTLSSTLGNGNWPLFFLFLPHYHLFYLRRCTNRCAVDENRWPGSLELFPLYRSHHNTHTIFLLSLNASPASARVCIECRSQVPVDFASLTARGCNATDGRFILINASRRACIVISTRDARIMDELIEGRFCRGIFNTIWYVRRAESLVSRYSSCRYT